MFFFLIITDEDNNKTIFGKLLKQFILLFYLFLKFYLCISSLAVLGRRCSAGSLVGENRGYSLAAVRRFLTAVASAVAEHWL